MKNLTKLYFHMFQGKYVVCRLSTNFFILQRLIFHIYPEISFYYWINDDYRT